ncbi:hypothetical protein QFZ79_003826 [Arthrobacter sp. V4I6]|uniref:hypothetical protein n=1 Tax=unclassified Arthrobacter TaxID=235627 RepID=UPI0027879A5E|nr:MULTISPECIES: hypothetical protein [unclassified Arthrobacter]MDQ0821449.1 hypothetical protein [Arthrobacter sp. V1I7]MDQ0855715.1 hypothetical protein [Arthrobacter sp. V4I6]
MLRQIKAVLVTAPAAQREKLARHTGKALLEALRRVRSGEVLAGTEAATMIALRHLARRHHGLTEEIDEATDQLRALVKATSPALLAAKGIGIVTAAQLLVLKTRPTIPTTGNSLSPAFWVIGVVILGIIAISRGRETANRALLNRS